MTPARLKTIAKFVRSAIIRSTTAAGSGHPTSSLSAADLLVGLFFGGVFRADLNRPQNPANDRFILSKGHAAPLLYSLYAAAGKVTQRELLTLRTLGSRLQGHPMPTFPYTEIPTGSLGQGLSAGIGLALAARINQQPARTYVLLGDSEMAEGSNWEALQLAGHLQLNSLTAILDVNRLGQSGPTMLGHDVQRYARRIASFGWKTIIINGHDFTEIIPALQAATQTKHQPTAIIAKTTKGQGVSFLEDREGWHGRTLNPAEAVLALQEIASPQRIATPKIRAPKKRLTLAVQRGRVATMAYDPRQKVATREALANALVRLAPRYPKLIVLDAEVKNSTDTERFERRYPQRFIETYIAEQNMVGIANGLAARGLLPVAATFAAFLTRAFDQLRLAQYSGSHQVYLGTHAGISIGQDGPSQMGLEDIALFRTLANATILYPADAVSAERLTELALKHSGLVYLRATRAATPIIYRASDIFKIGGSRILRTSNQDRATIVAAGITLHEALAAAERLARKKIAVRVIDLYSIKPVDVATLRRAVRATKNLIIVEDHRPEGGIAEAVRSALGSQAGSVSSLAVKGVPQDGSMADLLRFHGISQSAIVRSVLARIAK